jgi:ubiquinone/menaquinone biosynthesis C-methylase UbiE
LSDGKGRMNTDISNLLKDELRQAKIPRKEGVFMLLNDKFLVNDNKKFMEMYNRMSRGYDIAETVIGRIKYGNAINKMRSDLMSKLEWKDNSKVLYVSIGTGRDLNFIPMSINAKSLKIVGLDISFGMLKKCRKNFESKLDISLFNCAAEELPFVDNAFDIVFHVGGINFFSDKSAALKEMVRVAKPGTKILISDETQDWIDNQFKKSRLSKKYFNERHFDLSELESHIPRNVNGKKIELMWENKSYCLTFRKIGA